MTSLSPDGAFLNYAISLFLKCNLASSSLSPGRVANIPLPSFPQSASRGLSATQTNPGAAPPLVPRREPKVLLDLGGPRGGVGDQSGATLPQRFATMMASSTFPASMLGENVPPKTLKRPPIGEDGPSLQNTVAPPLPPKNNKGRKAGRARMAGQAKQPGTGKSEGRGVITLDARGGTAQQVSGLGPQSYDPRGTSDDPRQEYSRHKSQNQLAKKRHLDPSSAQKLQQCTQQHQAGQLPSDVSLEAGFVFHGMNTSTHDTLQPSAWRQHFQADASSSDTTNPTSTSDISSPMWDSPIPIGGASWPYDPTAEAAAATAASSPDLVYDLLKDLGLDPSPDLSLVAAPWHALATDGYPDGYPDADGGNGEGGLRGGGGFVASRDNSAETTAPGQLFNRQPAAYNREYRIRSLGSSTSASSQQPVSGFRNNELVSLNPKTVMHQTHPGRIELIELGADQQATAAMELFHLWAGEAEDEVRWMVDESVGG